MPYGDVNEGLRRRATTDRDILRARADEAVAARPALEATDRRSDPEKEMEAAAIGAAAWAPSVFGVGARLAGADGAADAAFGMARRLQERSAERDSDVDANLLNARSIGDVASGVRKLAISSALTMIAGVGAAGVGRGLARKSAMNAERQHIAAGTAQRMEAQTGVQSPMGSRAGDPRVAAAQQREAAVKQRDAARDAATAAVRRDPAAMARVERAGNIGTFVGGTAGTLPTMVAGSREYLEDADREQTLAILGHDVAAAAVGFLPMERLMGRVLSRPGAPQALEKNIRAQLKGAARKAFKEGGVQALWEGGTEAAQALIQRAGHRYVDENIELFSREAFDEYVANFVGGAVLGSVMGAGTEAGIQGADLGGRAAEATGRWTQARYGEAKVAIKDRLRAAADKVRAREQHQATPDDAGDAPVGSAAGLYQRARDGMAGAAEKAKGAAARLRAVFERQENEAALDQRSDELIQILGDMMGDRPDSEPFGAWISQVKTPAQRWMLAQLDPTYVKFERTEDLVRLGGIMEKFASGKDLNQREAATLLRVVDNPNTGIETRTLGAFADLYELGLRDLNGMARQMSSGATSGRATGVQQDAKSTAQVDDVADTTEAADVVESDTSFGYDLENAENRADGDTFDRLVAAENRVRDLESRAMATLPRQPSAPRDPAARRELHASQKQGVREVREQASAELESARTERDQLADAAKRQVLGEPQKKQGTDKRGRPYAYTTHGFVFDEARGAAGQRAFAEALNSPNTVEMVDGYTLVDDVPGETAGEGAKRRRLLNLNFLVEAQMARKSDQLAASGNNRGWEALKAALADAVFAGVAVKTDTLSPGEMTLPANPKKGRHEPTHLMTLTEGHVAALRDAVRAANAARKRRQAMSREDFMAQLEQRMESYGKQGARRVSSERNETRLGVAARKLREAPARARDAVVKAWLAESDRRSTARGLPTGSARATQQAELAYIRSYLERPDLSADEAFDAYIRANVRKSEVKGAKRAFDEVGLAASTHPKVLKATARIRVKLDKEVEQALAQYRRAAGRDLAHHMSEDVLQGEDTGVQDADHRLIPREAPRGSEARGTAGSGYVSDSAPVAAVAYGGPGVKDAQALRDRVEGSGAREGRVLDVMSRISVRDVFTRTPALAAAMAVLRSKADMLAFGRVRALRADVSHRSAVLAQARARTPKARREAIKTTREAVYDREYVNAREQLEREGGAVSRALAMFENFQGAGPENTVAARRMEALADQKEQALKAGEDTANVDRQIRDLMRGDQRMATAARLLGALRNNERIVHEAAVASAESAVSKFDARREFPTEKQAETDLKRAEAALAKALKGADGKRHDAVAEAMAAVDSERNDRVHSRAIAESRLPPTLSLDGVAMAVANAELRRQVEAGALSEPMYLRRRSQMYLNPDIALAYLNAVEGQASVTHAAEDKAGEQFNSSNTRDAAAQRDALEQAFVSDARVAIDAYKPTAAVEGDMLDALPTLFDMVFGAERATGEKRAAAARAWSTIGMYVDGMNPAYDNRLRDEYEAMAASLVPESAQTSSEVVQPRRRTDMNEREAKAAALRASRRKDRVERREEERKPKVHVRKKKAEPAPDPVPEPVAAKAAESIGNTYGQHDLKAETSLLNALLKSMGLPPVKGVVELESSRINPERPFGIGGSYTSSRVIRMNPNLSGKERMSVLLHEVGHHIVYAKLAELTGRPAADLQRMGDADLLLVAMEHAPEVASEYQAWLAEREGADTVRYSQSSSPYSRATAQMMRGIAGRETGFHEWFADNVAKALEGNREVQSTVGKFFKDVADALRTLYIWLSGNKQFANYMPAKSVEAWVAQLFDPNVAAVKAATGKTVTPEGAKASVEAATIDAVRGEPPADPPSPPEGGGEPEFRLPDRQMGFTQTLRYIRETMPPQEQQIVLRMLNTKAGRDALQKMYAGMPRILKSFDNAAHGAEARIAGAFILWREGFLEGGSQSRTVFQTLKDELQKTAIGGGEGTRSASDDLAKVFGLADTDNYVERIFQDLATGKIARFKARGGYDVRKIEARMRGDRQRRWNTAVKHYTDLNNAIGRVFDGKGQRLRESGVAALRRLQAMLQKPMGETGEDPGYIPAVRNNVARYTARLRKIHGGLKPRESVRALTLLQRGVTDVSNEPMHVQDAVRGTRKILDELYGYMTSAGMDVGKRENFFPVMLDVARPQDQQKLRDLLSDPSYEPAIRKLFDGFEKSRQRDGDAPQSTAGASPADIPVDAAAAPFFNRLRSRLQARLEKADGTSAKRLEALIAINEAQELLLNTGSINALKKAVESTQNRLNERQGGDIFGATTLQKEIDFFDARIAQLEAAGVDPAAGAKRKQSKEAPAEPRPISELIENLVQGAMPSTDYSPASSPDSPKFKGERYRSMQFIYDALDAARKSGDAAAIAAAEKNVATFASLQTKDPADLIARYVEPAIKKAEYTRRFGQDGAKLEKLLERAKAQGATPAQLIEARDTVKAAIGTYGADGSPTLAALSPDLSKKLSGPRMKRFIHGMQAYQNIRLLPLAALTSLVDPVGIAVRSGGEFQATWDSYKVGLRGLFDKATQAEQEAMLGMLGASSDLFAEVAIAQPTDTSFANKANDWLFKVNGLSAWTKATRFMALEAAHHFILKHAGGANERSSLYLRELGLRPGDVRSEQGFSAYGRQGTAVFTSKVTVLTETDREALRGAGTPEAKADLARDERVRNALMQFVDEAILRPNPMQTPMWVSDPYMGLVAQYKSFAYAIYDQIYRRSSIEADRGNMRAFGAMLMYLPMMLGAEVLRELIQNFGGDERRKEWGVVEYTALAAERTGLYSPRFDAARNAYEDMERNNLPLSSQTGPTVQQAGHVYDALRGRRDKTEELQRALPGAAIHRRWDEAVGL